MKLNLRIIGPFATAAVAVVAVFVALTGLTAQSPTVPPPSNPLASLKTVPVPEPSNLSDFVADRKAAIALGKALFWDMQTGSDGQIACASCHFNAGADSRSKHQISPGLNQVNSDGTANPDSSFEVGGGPNYQLQVSDFPFHRFADPNDRDSEVVYDANDVTSSQGVFATDFKRVVRRIPTDITTIVPDQAFQINGIHVRRVEPRNTPTVVNAVFNFRNFWDGRAQNDFNGVDVFGARNPNAFVLHLNASGQVEKKRISLRNASLASQAVGPPLSAFEMSAGGRTFPDIGKKLTSLRPLLMQVVARDDSALGSLSLYPYKGLKAANYAAMIRAAFKPEWWNSKEVVQVETTGEISFIPTPTYLAANQYTMMQYNFAMFWGIALQMYQSTLVANDSRVDRFLDGDSSALTAQEQDGLAIFQGQGKCINCHGGPETTNASVRNTSSENIERMLMGNGGVAAYDNGFYNIGVRPTSEDLGVGGKDKFGNPLSMTRLCQNDQSLCSALNINTEIPAREIDGIAGGQLDSTERNAVAGNFKAPGLRNVELTAPYFHNGGQATLRQVVDFYNRGGDFHRENQDDLDPDIAPIGLSDTQKDALVAFLKAFTDERVRYQKAPFDHPQLVIQNGHPGGPTSVTNDGTGKATQSYMTIPAVGAKGGAPLKKFLGGPE